MEKSFDRYFHTFWLKEQSPSYENIFLSFIQLGGRLKRRLKNVLIVTVVGLGTFYGYRWYKNYQWFNEMTDSDRTIGTKPRVVVLGTGEE